MWSMIFLFFSGCFKHGPLNHVGARKYFTDDKPCLETLKTKMKATDCKQLSYHEQGYYNIFMRCHKPDKERGEFWDNYIFRISSIHYRYDENDQKIINEHTVCIDKTTRIEAYPPDFWDKKR